MGGRSPCAVWDFAPSARRAAGAFAGWVQTDRQTSRTPEGRVVPALQVRWTDGEHHDRPAGRGARRHRRARGRTGRDASAARSGAVGRRRGGRRAPGVSARSASTTSSAGGTHRDPAPQGGRPAAVPALADRPLDRERRRRMSACSIVRHRLTFGSSRSRSRGAPRCRRRSPKPRRRRRRPASTGAASATSTATASRGRQRWGTRRDVRRGAPAASARPTSTPTAASSSTSPRVRFGEYAREWIERYQGRTSRGFRESTRRRTGRCSSTRVIPYFDGVRRLRLAEIQPRDVKAFVRWLVEQERPARPAGCSAKSTIRQHVAVLRALLGDAMEEGLIRSNPARRRPRRRARGRRHRPARPRPRSAR